MRAEKLQAHHKYKAGAAATDAPPIRTFPTETRRAPLAWSSWLLGMLGLASAAGGVAMVWGPSRAAELADLTERMRAAGIQPGHVFAAAASLCGLSLVGLYVGRVARVLLRPGAIEECLSEVGADMAEFRNKLYEFENDHVHFRTTLDGVQKEVREHRQKDRSQEAVDALFQVAGSLDTLHARFDQRLSETSRGVEQTLSELGGVIESSRDYLQESLEETDQRVEALGRRLEELGESVAALSGTGSATSLAATDADPTEEPRLAAPEEAFAEEDAEEEPVSDLGLLDDLDDLEPEGWCDEAVQEEMAAIEEERSLEHREDLEPDLAPTSLELPSPPPEPAPEPGSPLSPQPEPFSPAAEPRPDGEPLRLDLEDFPPALPGTTGAPGEPSPEPPRPEASNLGRMEDVVRDPSRDVDPPPPGV